MTPRFYANARLKRIAGFVIIFSLFLSVYAFACSTPEDNKNDKEVGDPVSVTSGMLHSSYQDIAIPAGRGELPLEIVRNSYGYSSDYGLNQYRSLFGEGWTFNYGMSIIAHSTNAVLINENGEREIFNWNGRVWVQPKGNFSTLEGQADWPFTLTRKNGKIYNFDSLGRLVNIADRNGNQIRISYSGIINGRPVQVTDSIGRSLTFSYNAQGLVSSITWPNGGVTTYDYQAHYRQNWGTYVYLLSMVTDPDGNRVTYAYSPYDLIYAMFGWAFRFEDFIWQITSATDARGNVTSFSYYDQAPGSIDYLKTKRVTYADGTFMDFSYNESLRFTLTTNERGYDTTYNYDINENITLETDPKGNTTTTVYDADYNKVSITNKKNRTTYYTYDNRGNCTSITDPLNRINSFTYEPRFSFVETATDVKGKTTTNYYDGKGNLEKVVYPEVDGVKPVELFTYNQYGQITQQIDANGIITKYDYYPSTGYLEQKTSDYGHINAVTRFGYDSLGNVTSVTDPLGNTTTSEYNKIGLLIRTISPPPYYYQTKYFYDGNKNVIRTERQLSQ